MFSAVGSYKNVRNSQESLFHLMRSQKLSCSIIVGVLYYYNAFVSLYFAIYELTRERNWNWKFGLWPFARFRQELSLIIILNVFRCRKLQKRQKFSRKPFSFDAFAKIVLFYHCKRLILLQRIFFYVFCNIWIDSWTKLKLKRARVCFFS